MLRSTRLFSRLHNGGLRPWRAAVSLHGHTVHSRESFHGLPWSPPPSPVEALALESRQIQDLQLSPLVALTDHDTLEAPLALRAAGHRHVPISVEWTVPYRGAILHLGLHNLPPARARERMAALARFTLIPREYELAGILDWLCEDPATLIVWNHPLWDYSRLGEARHLDIAQQFLRRVRPWIHALECNGLRPWEENRRVLRWGRSEALPTVGGGDRHGYEPSAMLNLTRAANFSEFAEEIRDDRRSAVLILPQYRQSILSRFWANLPARYNRKHEAAILSLPAPGHALRSGTEVA